MTAANHRNQRVIIRAFGSADRLELVEEPVPEPAPGEIRIAVEAAGVSQADITIRHDMYPQRAALPFGLGYDVVGRVDAVGAGVTTWRMGDRVAAITVRGGYARYLCWPADDVVEVPAEIDAGKAVSLLLNYLTAYQLLHRAAKVKAGEKVLVTSAAGGVGTALLQLGRVAGLELYGTASSSKQEIVRGLGAKPVDYTREDVVARVRALSSGGVDVALDAIGGASFTRSYRTLRRGGRFVGYGFTSKMGSPWLGRLDTFARLGWMMAVPDGRSAGFYGIMFMKRSHPDWFWEDLRTLFRLHVEGAIDPLVAAALPLVEARKAHEMIESGTVQGKLVLVPAV
jgi:NADPH:quinone reductase-like Zn-dependent oxidoreductase